jgi:hypothetical protein
MAATMTPPMTVATMPPTTFSSMGALAAVVDPDALAGVFCASDAPHDEQNGAPLVVTDEPH